MQKYPKRTLIEAPVLFPTTRSKLSCIYMVSTNMKIECLPYKIILVKIFCTINESQLNTAPYLIICFLVRTLEDTDTMYISNWTNLLNLLLLI